ncbi:MGMT family protein [Spongiivirga citrea]|uniref:Uncharacterized protein n=1 Tax=Spongiivirga citrea TaxID=1481457 RepID=A0A6M0CI47_9FLAO|nr:MGMT family protein [Spongiivirga citrea]NER17565.1 hypothetical protein [Spongiivirga citrea]
MKKSWREYINTVEEKIHDITPEWESKMGKGKILIPKPLDIERIINRTKKGELLTTDIIREQLAKEKNVRLTASAPTKIYLKHIAFAAEEEIAEGNDNITPYWRVLLPKGLINEKFPGGYEKQQKLLKSEGHKIEQYGKRKKIPKVVSFQESLIKF